MAHRIALIGVGPMAALHAKVLPHVPGLELVSCASRDPAKAAAFAAEHGIFTSRTMDEVFADPQADALWLVAPCDVMAPLALRAAATGLPLFLEKPVGLTADETAEVAEAVNAPSMVGLNRRFYEVVQKARAIIAEAGGLRAIEVHMPEDLIRVPRDRHADKTFTYWQFANSVHLLDLFRYFGGEVSAIETMNDLRSEVDRSFNALLRFESGAVGHYNAQWYAPGGWRVTLYADGVCVELRPIEKATVMRRGAETVTIEAQAEDSRFKPGLFGQAAAFCRLLDGHSDPVIADLNGYLRSVRLVDKLTRP